MYYWLVISPNGLKNHRHYSRYKTNHQELLGAIIGILKTISLGDIVHTGPIFVQQKISSFLYQLCDVSKIQESNIFEKHRIPTKIHGARVVKCSKFHAVYPKTLRSTIRNLIIRATWLHGFTQPCSKCNTLLNTHT